MLAGRSDIGIAAQVTAPGATWLDHRLVEREPMPLVTGGFGHEVRDAMTARAEYHIDEGLARRLGQRVILQRDLLNTLSGRELDAVGAKLSAETGLPSQSAAGERIAGTYRRRLTLTSGRFAVIDNALGFQLVPWSPSLESQLGRGVLGTVKDSGGVAWAFGRKRGLGL